MNRLTARQGLAFEDFCWQTPGVSALYLYKQKSLRMIPQGGSSNNVLRWPEDFFSSVDSRARTLFLFFKGDCVSHSPPAHLSFSRHQMQHFSTCSTFAAQMAETGLGPTGCSNRISSLEK